MSHCSCGNWIPDGQRTCSMCYGDPDHGRDGYYRKWLEDQEQEAEMERQQRQQEEQQQEQEAK